MVNLWDLHLVNLWDSQSVNLWDLQSVNLWEMVKKHHLCMRFRSALMADR